MAQWGWRSGESAHLSPMWPEFDSRTRRHMWVEFAPRVFSPGTPIFTASSKTNISKFQFDLKFKDHRFASPIRLLSVTLAKQSPFIF